MSDPTEVSPYRVLSPKPLWSEVVSQIRQLIVSGEIPLGSKLPSERQLCTELGVSRVSLREAFRVLQVGGYIETRPGSGTYARMPDPHGIRDHWLEQDIRIVELLELRMVVEPGSAALAAKRRTREAIDGLQLEVTALREAGQTGNFDAAMAADQKFHVLIGDNVANPSLTQLMHQMQELCGAERAASLQVPGQIQRAALGHQEILDAILAEDDTGAADAMRRHLSDALGFLTDHTNARYLPDAATEHERHKNET